MDGVVFDFDGVIARSMEQHAEAYRRVLAPLGIVVRDRDVFLQEGARSETIIRGFLQAAGQDAAPERVRALADEKQAAFRSRGRPPLYAGAEEAVHAVRRAGRPAALVTGTRRENLEWMVPHLLPLCSAVVSQESYRHDKPHPEPYESAATALGLPPARLVAVENAVRGVQSARAAGYAYVIAIPTTLTPSELRAAGAHAVVADHAALRAALLARMAKA